MKVFYLSKTVAFTILLVAAIMVASFFTSCGTIKNGCPSLNQKNINKHNSKPFKA